MSRKTPLRFLALAGAASLAFLTGCATTISFETLKPAPIDVENYKSVALIPFVAGSVSHGKGSSDFSANLLASGFKVDQNAVIEQLVRRGKSVLVDGSMDFFRQDIASKFTNNFQNSLLGEELFIVLPQEDVQKANAELGGNASPLDIARKLNVAAFYTGEIQVEVVDSLATTEGTAWIYPEKVTKTVQKEVIDPKTEEIKIVEEQVTTTENRLWLGDGRPPAKLRAERTPDSLVFAVRREVVAKITYKFINTADGTVLSTRTYTKKLPKTSPVILYDINAEASTPAYNNSRGVNTLLVNQDTVLRQAQPAYRWITSELRPSTITVSRQLMNDQSKDKEQKKALKGYLKHVKEKRYDMAEAAFLSLWKEKKNVAAAFNATMLMEMRKDYTAALAMMEEILTVQNTPDLQKKRNLLKSAASAYAKAMEQKKKIENNAIKIQKILDEKGYKVVVEVTDAGIKLILDDIKFKADSADYEASEESKLQSLSGIVSLFPQYDVMLIGHSANPPGADKDFAMKLSADRAKSIANFFIKSGVRTDANVFYEGRGVNEPIADNDTAEGRAKNRRIEMTFVIN